MQDSNSTGHTLAKASVDGIKLSEVTSENKFRDLLC